MKIIALVGSCLVAGFTVSADTGNLKRLTLRQDTLGWEAVGRIEIGKDGYCTGTLIAPDQVLTAAHCIFDQATGQRHDPGQLSFRAALSDGKSVAQSTVLRTVADPAYEPRRGTSPQSVRHDAALLQLANAIPAAVAPPFPVATLDQHSHDISIVSYARGRDAALSWQRNCDVIGRDQSLFAFDCDVYFGSSGAPVFDLSAGRARIVSIISAGSRTETGTVSYGMALPGLVSDLQQALRTGRGVTEADKAASGVKARILTGGAKGNGGAKFLQP